MQNVVKWLVCLNDWHSRSAVNNIKNPAHFSSLYCLDGPSFKSCCVGVVAGDFVSEWAVRRRGEKKQEISCGG